MAHKLVILEWLYKADQDFAFASINLKENEYYDQICFNFQQSAEKYLKAYIVSFNLKFEKLHDLVKLLDTCIMHDSTLNILKDASRFLTPFYFETRYADGIFAVCTRDQALQACQDAEKIQSVIRDKLGIKKEITQEEIMSENKKVDEILKR